jgi:hypothetical protein
LRLFCGRWNRWKFAMSKKQAPLKPRHLQLVSSASSRPTNPEFPGDMDSESVHGELLEQIAAEGRPRLRGGWPLILALLLAIGVVYVGVHLGASHLPGSRGVRFDSRRFGISASVHHHSDPQAPIVLTDGDTVRTDDAWQFVLHNRSRKNMWFGIFAASPDGQITWFYPRDGAGADIQTLPLPAINTVTLPDSVTPETLSPGMLQIYGLFTPAPVALSQVEMAYATHGVAGLRGDLGADVEALAVHAIAP